MMHEIKHDGFRVIAGKTVRECGSTAVITEMLVEKRLGQRRPGLTDDLYQMWREVGGLWETREYRDVLLRADRHALWLAGLVSLAAPPVSSAETERTDTLDVSQTAA
jgi:hypothetical protein